MQKRTILTSEEYINRRNENFLTNYNLITSLLQTFVAAGLINSVVDHIQNNFEWNILYISYVAMTFGMIVVTLYEYRWFRLTHSWTIKPLDVTLPLLLASAQYATVVTLSEEIINDGMYGYWWLCFAITSLLGMLAYIRTLRKTNGNDYSSTKISDEIESTLATGILLLGLLTLIGFIMAFFLIYYISGNLLFGTGWWTQTMVMLFTAGVMQYLVWNSSVMIKEIEVVLKIIESPTKKNKELINSMKSIRNPKR